MNDIEKAQRIEELRKEIIKMDKAVNNIYRNESDKTAHKVFYGYYEMMKELRKLEG